MDESDERRNVKTTGGLPHLYCPIKETRGSSETAIPVQRCSKSQNEKTLPLHYECINVHLHPFHWQVKLKFFLVQVFNDVPDHMSSPNSSILS